MYENTILDPSQNFFGLTGPKGFGKSAFLHYFAAKYCADPSCLVAYVPWYHPNLKTLERSLAHAFYKGCRISGLTGYKELTYNDSLVDMMQYCSDFAFRNEKHLLLIIDQMKPNPAEVTHVFNTAVNELLQVGGMTVVLSSSISNQVSSVFGSSYQTLDRYAFNISSEEATLLSKQLNKKISASKLTGLPFQIAAEEMRGTLKSLVQIAASFAEALIGNPNDAGHLSYVYLHMVADSTVVDT